jgi:glutamine synthetase
VAIGPFHEGPLQAADALSLARFVVYDISASMGLQASMIPKPFGSFFFFPSSVIKKVS